ELPRILKLPSYTGQCVWNLCWWGRRISFCWERSSLPTRVFAKIAHHFLDYFAATALTTDEVVVRLTLDDLVADIHLTPRLLCLTGTLGRVLYLLCIMRKGV